MVKKVNKLMTIMALVGAGVVGVNSAELVATNVSAAYEISSMHYLTIKWETSGSSFPDRLMVKRVGGSYQDNFGELFANKTAIYGSKDIYINLKGTYNLYFADHHNKNYHNYIYGDILADTIMFDDYDMRFLLNGDLVVTFDMYDIQSNLNFSEDFYIFRQGQSSEYQQGYDDGFLDGEDYEQGYNDGYNDGNNEGYNVGYMHGEQAGYYLGYDDGYDDGFLDGENYEQGYNDGYNMGREDYGIRIGDDWKTADWWGSYQYAQGLYATDGTGFVSLLSAIFGGLGDLLSIEILPGIYIGAIVAVPLVFGIIFFILGKRKGD